MQFLELGAFAVRSLAATNVQEKLILGLVVNPEAIALATGWDVSGFEREFGAETLVYKAEIRKGRKELATQTFYVRVRQ